MARTALIASAVAFALLAAPGWTGSALAQAPAAKPKADNTPRRPPTLDELFERLAKAKDETEAKGVAGLIERRWQRSGSDTADVLMTRAMEAAKGGDQPLAVELLDRVIVLQPDWAEAWNKRATVFYMMGDTTRSVADLREVLTREPRHFGALSGLGIILLNAGEERKAFDAFKRALAIHPHLGEVKSAVQKLAPDYEGRDI